MPLGSSLTSTALTRTARIAVWLAWIGNRAFGAAVSLALALSFALSGHFATVVAHMLPGADMPQALEGIRLLMAVGIIMALATDRLLAALGDIIATAGAGDPFIADNAARLQVIGWCLVVLQLLDIPAALIAHFYPAMGSAAPDGDISIVGWIAVLMAFVLARVFAAGSAMRDDLEGTV